MCGVVFPYVRALRWFIEIQVCGNAVYIIYSTTGHLMKMKPKAASYVQFLTVSGFTLTITIK